MATSTVPTAKANLVTQLQARGGLAGVQVTNGPPFVDPQREFIWVGTAEGSQEQLAMGGPRRETYDLHVIISVEQESEDVVAADTRCFALSAEVEAQLRTDPTINGAVEHAEFGDFKLGEFSSADGINRISELVVSIGCNAFLA